MAQTPEHAARVLGLIGEPTLEEVKRVRREMALKYHPDRCADAARGSRHMARINAAVDTLLAHVKRTARNVSSTPRTGDHAARSHKNARQTETLRTKKTQAQRPKTKDAPKRPKRTVQTDVASAGKRRAFKAERALSRRAEASYLSVLDQIGSTKTRPRVDLQILRFEASAP